MSRVPQQLYGYHPSGYYYEEADDSYIGDYSEGENISESPPHMVAATADLTELYRGKVVTMPMQHDTFHHQQQQPYYYAQDYYYYEPVQSYVDPRRSFVSPTPAPVATPSAYRRRPAPTSHQEERIAHFYATDVGDEAYNTMSYRSSPQIPQQRPVTARVVPSATLQQPTSRRHAVTVRTPRFFRRPQTTSLRKPSTLCLPVNCQPDPAVIKKPKSVQNHITEKQKLTKPVETIEFKPDSGGDVEGFSDLDTMLNKYEEMFEMFADERGIKHRIKPECKLVKSNIPVPSTKALKPRIPPSIKAKQQKLKLSRSGKPSLKHSSTSMASKTGRIEVEEITTEVLDQLLAELTNNGCENKLKTDKLKKEEIKQPKVTETVTEQQSLSPGNNQLQEETAGERPKSVNYKEISEHMFEAEQQGKEAASAKPKKFDASSQVCHKGEPYPELSRAAYYNQPTRVPLEEALELHKSKSYIVNLIDRALSKELGTLPEIKYKEAPCTVSGTVSTDTMVKPIQTKTDRDLCVEISQALTESYISNPPLSVESKQELCCPCPHQREEPLYLRQLRQLRWGHLKHIQREVRRLEDLERFLDSCSSTSNF